MKIYIDTAASGKTDEKVVEAMLPYFTEKYANASSMHEMGQEARRAVEDARAVIAKSINAKPEEIYFTSGGTEGNNTVVKGLAFKKEKGHIIVLKIEHDCILNAAMWLEKRGFEVTYLGVDEKGFVKTEELEKAIRKDTILVSVMHANNEIGTIQNLKKIGEICRKHKVLFHTDACQSYMKTDIDVEKMNIDMMTINAHKIHGPKGVGALFIKKGIKIEPLLHGGGHEKGLRSGTENVPGIVGFAKAVQLMNKKENQTIVKLRDKLIKELLKIERTRLNGPEGKNRLCNNINVTFERLEGESILMRLNDEGIYVSTGSACSSQSLEPSHVLKAIGLPHEIIHGSIRFSLSRYNTEEEIDYVIEKTKSVIKELRKFSPIK